MKFAYWTASCLFLLSGPIEEYFLREFFYLLELNKILLYILTFYEDDFLPIFRISKTSSRPYLAAAILFTECAKQVRFTLA
jgi:hypothetical protein